MSMGSYVLHRLILVYGTHKIVLSETTRAYIWHVASHRDSGSEVIVCLQLLGKH